MMGKLPRYQDIVNTLSTRSKVGQLFMPAAFINDTEAHVQALENLIREQHIGGLCFFHSPQSAATNFEGTREVPYHPDSLQRLKELIDRYQQAAPYPLLMAMDAEWGLAMRVERTPRYPYSLTLGALGADSNPLIYEVGLRMAADCRDAGIHWNLSPVIDINSHPENPVISYRSFGNRPETVVSKSLQILRGFQDGGILSCVKHFPGHGDTAVDSHLELPVLNKETEALEAEEFIPFRELIKAGVPAVMTGHLSVPPLDPSGLPASLSEKIIGVLRRELGFEGAIVTDALNMQALSRIDSRPEQLNLMAVEAGNDMLCFASEIPQSIDLILGVLSESRLEASFQRVWKLKESVFRTNTPAITSRYTPEKLNWELARRSLCEINKGSTSPLPWMEGITSLLYYGERPDVFTDRVGEVMKTREVEWEKDQPLSKLELPKNERIVLALRPPSMKPGDDFGLPRDFFDELKLLTSQKKVQLYLFGNPYILNKLPVRSFYGVVCAFEPLEALQEAAASHFLGRLQANGELPIDINYD
jgi:beta-N-acetylhexosaminidase